MIIGFIIWTLVSLVMLGIGIWSYNSKESVGFFTGVKPPKVTDVKKYNHAVAFLWFAYAFVLECLGIPFLFLEQNSAGFIPVVIGAVAASLALAIGFFFVEKKYKNNK